MTGLGAYKPMCPKRLYTVCLETVVPGADETVVRRGGCQLRRRPRQLIMVKNDVRHPSPRVAELCDVLTLDLDPGLTLSGP
ncbi:hypothetical protein TNCV_921371 [Trichonephila clavipes]|nr:hypothetical protein TNCV_921371 [Trichonephila clavipes]